MGDQTEITYIHPVTLPEAAMKAGLHHRTHQVVAYTLTSDSLMAVKLWPLAVVARRLRDLWNQKTRWGMEGGGRGGAGWLLGWCVDTEGRSARQLLLWYGHLRDIQWRGTATLRWFNIGNITHLSDSETWSILLTTLSKHVGTGDANCSSFKSEILSHSCLIYDWSCSTHFVVEGRSGLQTSTWTLECFSIYLIACTKRLPWFLKPVWNVDSSDHSTLSHLESVHLRWAQAQRNWWHFW